jgi:hypothetical protein
VPAAYEVRGGQLGGIRLLRKLEEEKVLRRPKE